METCCACFTNMFYQKDISSNFVQLDKVRWKIISQSRGFKTLDL